MKLHAGALVHDVQNRVVPDIGRADDAALRGAVIASLLIGIRVGRELLELDELAEAQPERVAELMRTAFAALADR